MIAKEFNTQSDLQVTGDQCSRKWTKLTTKQKEVSDHNNKSGNDKKTWKFCTEMEECIGGNASVNPTYILESSSGDIQYEEDSDDSEENSNPTPKKKKKHQTRGQRRSARVSHLRQRC